MNLPSTAEDEQVRLDGVENKTQKLFPQVVESGMQEPFITQ